MKTFFKKAAPYLLSLALLTAPILALAQTGGVSEGLNSPGLSSQFGFGSLQRQTTLKGLLIEIIRIMLLLAGIIAVMFVIIGGYYYVTAQGNEEQAEKGKNTLINAIIGIVVIILSYVIINVVSNLVSSSSGLF